MAEHSTVNRRVAGSSPAWGVFYCKIKAGLVPALDLTKVFKVGIIEQTLQEFNFFELIGVCFKYILIFLVGNR